MRQSSLTLFGIGSGAKSKPKEEVAKAEETKKQLSRSTTPAKKPATRVQAKATDTKGKKSPVASKKVVSAAAEANPEPVKVASPHKPVRKAESPKKDIEMKSEASSDEEEDLKRRTRRSRLTRLVDKSDSEQEEIKPSPQQE